MSIKEEQINMIKQQLRTNGVLSEKILDLYEKLPRHEFVPGHFKHFAYSDLQIELSHEQRMMTPVEEVSILQALNLNGKETVLEIGTGSGFLTALLSQLAKKVISVEYFQDMTTLAAEKLKKYECNNVELLTSDASRGFFEKAPYDVIIITSAIEDLSDTLKLQVAPMGKLFAIIGEKPLMQGRLYQLDSDSKWSYKILFETCLPMLIDKSSLKEHFVF